MLYSSIYWTYETVHGCSLLLNARIPTVNAKTADGCMREERALSFSVQNISPALTQQQQQL